MTTGTAFWLDPNRWEGITDPHTQFIWDDECDGHRACGYGGMCPRKTKCPNWINGTYVGPIKGGESPNLPGLWALPYYDAQRMKDR